MLRLFPNVQARGLPLKLFHYDEIAGSTKNGDMQEALTNFCEEWHGPCHHEFIVLHT